jgi:hypothetical protein
MQAKNQYGCIDCVPRIRFEKYRDMKINCDSQSAIFLAKNPYLTILG